MSTPEAPTSRPSQSRTLDMPDGARPDLAKTPQKSLPAIGEVIAGCYEIVRELGRGGMGFTFLARDRELHRLTVLKFINWEVAESEKRFRREKSILGRVGKTSYVIEYYAGNPDYPFLAIEYAAGGDLCSLIRKNNDAPLSETEALTIIAMCCEGLKALHRHGVVHRDVKPGNIFLTEDGKVRIGDFGLAINVKEQDAPAEETDHFAGTPSYAAPEQFSGKVDFRTDIYAVGEVLFYLLTASDPFQGASEEELKRKKRNPSAIPDPRRFNADITAATSNLIRRCLAPQKKNRPQTAGELLTLVNEIMKTTTDSEDAIPTVESRVSEIRHEREKSMTWLAACVKNFWVTPSAPPPSFPRHVEAAGNHLLGAGNVVHGEFLLDYEPRSLEVCRTPPRVAVGTKSGRVLVVSWRSEKASWAETRFGPSDFHSSGVPSEFYGSGVRALTFVTDRLLVAGCGIAQFIIMNCETREMRSVSTDVAPGDGAYQRFRRIIPLRPADSGQPGAIAIGLTEGDFIHILHRRGDDDYFVKVAKARDVIPDWDERWGRPVAAVWSNQRLWLLTKAGWIVRYKPAPPATGERREIPLEEGPSCYDLNTNRPTNNPTYRLLAGCVMGLAVVVSDFMTFLRFRYSADNSEPEIEKADKSSGRESQLRTIQWYHHPKIQDCAVFWPYYYYYCPEAEADPAILAPEESPCARSVDKREPIWIVAGTDHSGLSLIGWSDDGDHLRRSARHLAMAAGKALHTAVGLWRRNAPPVLVCATRDHKLEIASVLDRHSADRQLAAFLDDPAAARSPSFDEVPAIRWWREFYRPRGEPLPIKRPTELNALTRELGCVDRANLRRLTRSVFQRWRKGAPSTDTTSNLKLWVLAILRHAHQFGEGPPVTVARIIHDLIDAELTGSEGHGGELPAEVRSELDDFRRFLRKWLIHGHTYGAKRYKLYELFLSNYNSSRPLDGLFYISRLLRKRVDGRWRAETSALSQETAIWHIVAPKNGDFAVYSATDGCIGAISAQGEVLSWRILAPTADLGVARLELTNNDTTLRRIDSQLFFKEYFHGPFARRLLLIENNDNPAVYLLAFGLKGWRNPTDDDQSPRLCLLLIEKAGKTIEVKDVKALRATSELYGLACHARQTTSPLRDTGGEKAHRAAAGALSTKDDRTRESEFFVQLFAGTRGLAKDREDARFLPTPFVEYHVKYNLDQIVSLQETEVMVRPIAAAQRVLLRREADTPEAAYNPCWSLLVLESAAGSKYLWAGFQDGTLRAYREIEESAEPDAGGERHSWQEKEFAFEDQQRPVADPGAVSLRLRPINLQVSAAIWYLVHVAGRDSDGKEKDLLAYGTGDGVIGVIRITPPLLGTPEYPLHVVHSRLSAAITSLIPYRDENKSRLLAVSQNGGCFIFDLDYDRVAGEEMRPCECGEVPDRTEAGKASTCGHFHYPGYRLDHFRLQHSVGAVAFGGSAPTEPEKSRVHLVEEAPRFFVGAGDGHVYSYTLILPKGSARRRRAAVTSANLFNERIAEGPKSRTTSLIKIAESSRHEWLRVLTVGDYNFRRFSIWHSLKEITDRPRATRTLKECPTFAEETFKTLYNLLHELADEAYERRPFTPAGVKMIWEEGAKISNMIAEYALHPATTEDDRRRYFGYYSELNDAFSYLCNRWIGLEMLSEGRVLIHNFMSLFDWADVVIIAAAALQPATIVAGIRTALLRNLIQRCLNHSEKLVPLETLRIINTAILRAIVNSRVPIGGGSAGEPEWRFAMRPESSSTDEGAGAGVEPLGYIDLMTTVGDLWERFHESLPPSDPLMTEIVHFFANSLVLVPGGAMITGQVISESKLTKRGNVLALAIEDQARSIAKLFGVEEDSDLEDGLMLFHDYIDPEPDLGLILVFHPRGADDEAQATAWRRLFQAAQSFSGTQAATSSGALLVEQQYVLVAASWLSWLDHDRSLHPAYSGLVGDAKAGGAMGRTLNLPPGFDRDRFSSLLQDLNQASSEVKYFTHSWPVLRWLYKMRAEVILKAEILKKAYNIQNIRAADSLCAEIMEDLKSADLFQPQVNHYRRVVQSWRAQLLEHAMGALQVLRVLDDYNTHVYQMVADSLFHKVTELSMRSNPLDFDSNFAPTSDGQLGLKTSVRSLVRGSIHDDPLLADIYSQAERMVDASFMGGTLLALAKEYLIPQVRGYEGLRTVGVEEVCRILWEAAFQVGLQQPSDLAQWWWDHTQNTVRYLPGSPSFWATIAHEVSRNVSRYCHVPRWRERKEVFLKAALCANPQRTEFAFFLSGNVSYEHTLLATGEGGRLRVRVADVVEKLEKRIEEMADFEKQFHDPRAGARGMGLKIIRNISEFAGLEADLILADPKMSNEYPFAIADIPKRISDSKRRRAPLCLRIYGEITK